MCFPLALPKVEYFLCCVNLRSGTIFLALAQVIIGLIALLGYVFDTDEENQTDEYIFLTVLSIIAGILGVVLLVGFNKQSLSCFAAYVWAALAVVFIFGIRIFTSFAFDSFLAGFNATIIFIICWYILVTINSYYVIIFNEHQINGQDVVTSIHATQPGDIQLQQQQQNQTQMEASVKPMSA